MRKLIPALALVAVLTVATPAKANLLGDLIQGCVAGGAVLAGTTYFLVTPSLLGEWTAFPGYSLILNNAVVGCAFGAVISVFTN